MWVTIPGGSNNKVWRKFTFTAVTTTKIRVLASASPDGYSRVVERRLGPVHRQRHDMIWHWARRPRPQRVIPVGDRAQ